MADALILLAELCRVARAAGIEVRTQRFESGEGHPGGLCWLRGRRIALLNQAASPIDRTVALAEGLGRFDTESIAMSPAARRAISRTRYAVRSPGTRPGIVSHRPQAPSNSPMPSATIVAEPEEAVSLASYTTLGVGGAARFFYRCRSEAEIAQGLLWAESQNVPCAILGGGSNLVVSDAGFEGLVLHIGLLGIETVERRQTVDVRVGAGESWDAFVLRTVENGWQGLECLSGIPGLVGATPIQNVGAYGQEVAEVIQSVTALDRRTGRTLILKAKDCQFSYRDSLFKSTEPGRFVVLSVTFRLHKRGVPTIQYEELARALEPEGRDPGLAAVRAAVLALRRKKSMVLDPSDPNTRSCGSFFTNPIVSAEFVQALELRHGSPVPRFPGPRGSVKIPAAWLIEHAGFRKGETLGDAGLSDRHALAIVAHHGATASDVVRLAHHIRQRVLDQFDLELRPEPAFWGFEEPESHALPAPPRD